MLLQLRIDLPDRPGSLARVGRVLGALGADIRAMTVLDHGGARVLDEFTVAWPNYPGADRLASALSAVPGVTLQGAWRTMAAPDAFPDLDVLLHVKAQPARAMETLADALPGVLNADWAVVLGAPPERTTIAASPAAPRANATSEERARSTSEQQAPHAELPDIRPTHPLAFSSGPQVHLAAVPAVGNVTVYVARSAGGPAFHRVELARMTRLVEVACAIADTGAVRGLGRDSRVSSG
jgi:hypothetical protein